MTFSYHHQVTLNSLYDKFREESRNYTQLGNSFAPKEQMILSLERYQRIGNLIENLESDKLKKYKEFEKSLDRFLGGTD